MEVCKKGLKVNCSGYCSDEVTTGPSENRQLCPKGTERKAVGISSCNRLCVMNFSSVCEPMKDVVFVLFLSKTIEATKL